MEIRFDEITDQQCADIIAHFVKRKNVDEIIIHTKTEDIVITKKPTLSELDDISDFGCDFGGAAACALIASSV